MSSGVDLTTGGSGTGGGGAGGMDILTKLAASMEALTNAIVSKFSGNGGQNATLKNNLKQDALSNLEDRLSLLFQRMSDGRKVTQGNIDSYDTLIKRLEKFKDANPSVIQGFKDHLASITAISEAQKALTALNKYYAQISKDQQIKDNKAAQDQKKANNEQKRYTKTLDSVQTTIRRLGNSTKLSQGSLYVLEDRIKKFAGVNAKAANEAKGFESILKNLTASFKSQQAAASKKKTDDKAKTKNDKIVDIADSIRTQFTRLSNAANISKKGLYSFEDKLKRLGKLAPELANMFKKDELNKLNTKYANQLKAAEDKKNKDIFFSAKKTFDKLSIANRKYYTELMSGGNITDRMMRKITSQRETLKEAYQAVIDANKNTNYKIMDISKIDDNTKIMEDNLKIQRGRDDKNKEQQKKDAKAKKEKESVNKALSAQTDRLFAFKKQIDMLGPAFTIGAKQAAKMLDEIKTYQAATLGTHRAVKAKELSPIATMLEERIEKAKGGKEEPIKKASGLSSIGSMIGKNIMNSITGALTSGIAGPIMAVLGMVAAPFKDLIDMFVTTIGVLIRWVLIATGLLGWLKRLELSLASFNARMEFSSDRMLSLDTAVQRASTGITKSVYELGSSVVSAVDNALMNPLTGFADIVNKISKFVGLVNPGLMEQYNRVMDNLMALIGSALQPVVIEITNLMYEFGVQLKPMIEMLGGYLAKALRALAMALIPLIPQLIMGLTQLAGALIGYVAQMGVNLAKGGVSANREQRIKDEEARLNISQGTDKIVRTMNNAPEVEAIKAAQYTNRAIATKTVDREIKAELDAQQKNPASDFMDMAVAKNARFTGGMEMGKSSIQKAFEASSAYGVPGQSQDDQLKQAQLEFYTDPTAWVKKAMGIMGAPPQVTGGGGGGSADGSHLNPLQKLELAKRVVNAGTGSAKTIVSAVTLGIF
jgi:hypothetical protein